MNVCLLGVTFAYKITCDLYFLFWCVKYAVAEGTECNILRQITELFVEYK